MPAEEPVRLRPHHLLCILTYRGVGYTPAFALRMNAIVSAIAQGASVAVVAGPDSICAGLDESDPDHCHCTDAVTAAMDLTALSELQMHFPPFRASPLILDHALLSDMRKSFAEGMIRSACQHCSWNRFCTVIVAENFAQTILLDGAGCGAPVTSLTIP